MLSKFLLRVSQRMYFLHPIFSAQSKHSRTVKQSPINPDVQEISHVKENVKLFIYGFGRLDLLSLCVLSKLALSLSLFTSSSFWLKAVSEGPSQAALRCGLVSSPQILHGLWGQQQLLQPLQHPPAVHRVRAPGIAPRQESNINALLC